MKKDIKYKMWKLYSEHRKDVESDHCLVSEEQMVDRTKTFISGI